MFMILLSKRNKRWCMVHLYHSGSWGNWALHCRYFKNMPFRNANQ